MSATVGPSGIDREAARNEGTAIRGAGRAAFAATLPLIAGTLNVIYGIGALDSANIFTDERRFVLTNLNTLGWVLIALGVVQITGGLSLFAGNTYGRIIGIVGAGLGALGALFSIGGANPWWSLAVFALCVYVLYGLIVVGQTSALLRVERERRRNNPKRRNDDGWINK